MERNCSGSSRSKDGFTDLLLSWSLAQISDENLYKNKVFLQNLGVYVDKCSYCLHISVDCEL